MTPKEISGEAMLRRYTNLSAQALSEKLNAAE